MLHVTCNCKMEQVKKKLSFIIFVVKKTLQHSMAYLIKQTWLIFSDMNIAYHIFIVV